MPSLQVLAATGEAADMADREIRVMQQLQHPNTMNLLAHSRAMAPMDADQDVTTYYMLFPLYKARRSLQMCALDLFRSLRCNVEWKRLSKPMLSCMWNDIGNCRRATLISEARASLLPTGRIAGGSAGGIV